MRAHTAVRRAFAAMLVVLGVVAGALVAAPASASPPAGLAAGAPPAAEPGQAGAATEATIVDMIHTSGLFGGTVPTATAQTPYPTSGLQDQRSVTTAQIVLDDPATPGAQDMTTYCIDLDTETTIGVHYALGDWTEANVPNLPYVQWILDHYYPKVPSAPAGGTDAEKVRAVQGAIWYFTDQFVVSRFYPTERAAVRTIVEAAQAALAGGSPPAPPLPTLEISPADLEGALPGDLVGPFAVSGSVPSAVIDFPSGTQVFADAAGTMPVADGSAIVPGTNLWVAYDADLAPESFTLSATATVPAGNVFLYDGANPPRTTAQKLVLAADAVVPIRASARVVPPAAGTGTLRVDLVIAGTAAGDQGRIDLEITCVDGSDSLTRPVSLPAGLAAGTHVVAMLPDLPAGTGCSVAQTADGATPFVDVVTGNSGPVVIAAGAVTPITITDTYTPPAPATGTLSVELTVDGPAAGAQSAIGLLATCTSPAPAHTITRDIAVPAGFTGAGVPVATIPDLPVGTECAVTQPVDGRNAQAALGGVVISPASIAIPAGVAVISVTDTYVVPVPPTGSLAVDVTISGAAAGQQDAIALTATCTLDGATTPHAMTVAAGATGTVRAGTVSGVEAESTCTLAQTADGANARAVLATSTVTPPSVVVSAGLTATLTLADVFVAPAPAPTPTPTPTPTPAPAPLPATGDADVRAWAVGAVAMLLAGAAAVFAATRRRRA